MDKRLKNRKRDIDRWWMGKVRSLDIGERLRLVPFWERGIDISDRTRVIIDPGPSFGAGDHPTTIMALELMEETLKHRSQGNCAPTLLDVGTGTGVLAIAGKTLGTGFTVGLDIDSASVFTARRNVELNGLDLPDADLDSGVQLVVGDAGCMKSSFHIVTVNLVAPVLLRLKEDLIDKIGKTLILSGMADVMVDEVLTAFSSGDLRITKIKSREGWNAALLRKSSA